MKTSLSTWLINKFTGGLSDSSKRGITGSFRAGQGLDFTTDPDVLSGGRKLTKESGSTVTDLIKWFVTQGTNLWSYGNGGKLYKRIANATWSAERTVSNSTGQGMEVFDNYLYYAYNKGFGRYGPLDGTPAFDDDFLVSATNEVDIQDATAAGQTYTATTAVNEGATHLQTFVPAADNITGIVLTLGAKGTGNVTVTVHTAANAVVAAVTIATADLPTTGQVRFMFSGVHTLTAAATYHFHVHSSVADATVVTGTTSDFETCRFATLQSLSAEDTDQEVQVANASIATAYTIPSAISEAATARQTFQPEKTTQTGLAIMLATVGASGDLTVTVHDEKDTVMATATIAYASLKYGGYMQFVYSTPWKAVIGATYHFHVTASAGTHTMRTSVASDLEGAQYRTFYQILETDNDYHPMLFFPAALGMAIGNGNFLAVYDGIAYRSSGPNEGNERLQFAKEEKVRCLATVGDYLAIGTWKGDDIDDHGYSNLYFWDGSASSYNAFKKMNGEINAMVTGDDGLLYVWHGGFGYISVYDGSLTLVKTIPQVGENKFIEIFPGAVGNWNGKTIFGISDGDSTTVSRGIYSYGRKTKNYPMALNLEAPISTGTVTGTGLQIGAVMGIGPDRYFVGWKDASTYGVDKVDTSTDQASATYESLIFDGGAPDHQKKSSAVKLTFIKLADGQTITVSYKLDRAASWTELGVASYANTSTGTKVQKSFALDKQWKEIELKFALATTTGAAPTLISSAMYFEFYPDTQE